MYFLPLWFQLQPLMFFTTTLLFCFFLSSQFLNSRIVITILFFVCTSFCCHLFWKKALTNCIYIINFYFLQSSFPTQSMYNFSEHQVWKFETLQKTSVDISRTFEFNFSYPNQFFYFPWSLELTSGKPLLLIMCWKILMWFKFTME